MYCFPDGVFILKPFEVEKEEKYNSKSYEKKMNWIAKAGAYAAITIIFSIAFFAANLAIGLCFFITALPSLFHNI